MEYSFPFRDILKDIHQINSGYPGYSHEYSFFVSEYLSGYPGYSHEYSFCDSEYLYLEKNILAYFWIYRTPLTRRCRAAGPIASQCCPSATWSVKSVHDGSKDVCGTLATGAEKRGRKSCAHRFLDIFLLDRGQLIHAACLQRKYLLFGDVWNIQIPI